MKSTRDDSTSNNEEFDLLQAVKESLQRKGILSKIKSHLRTEIFHTLEDKTVSMPEKPLEVYIANDIVREFLMSFQLNNSLSVYMEEIGTPQSVQVDRDFIGGELGLNTLQSDRNIPLLVLIVQYLMRNKKDLLENISSLQVQTSEAGNFEY